jgi:pimeloyl-ACP methyl ester carboxylesterase
MPFVTVPDGTRLYYEEAGAGEPLLLVQASAEHDSWDLLPTMSSPTLVIHGSEDQLNPTANAYLLAERIPGAELSLVKGGRHGYLAEFREEISRVVNGFLARHPL